MAHLRKMELGDVRHVLAIIEEHDDDDAEAAQHSFDNSLEHYFVFERDDKIVGVTGFQPIEATDNSYWLSWTYLKEALCGQGLGRLMLTELLEKLRERDARKVFVKVSDYVDPEEGPIYEPALKLYQSQGFILALTLESYYDEGESMMILELDLKEPPEETPVVAEESPNIRFNGLFEIGETDDAYSFSWTVDKEPGFFAKLKKTNFTAEDLRLGVESAKNSDARKVFLSFPSNLPLVLRPLQQAGFDFIGELKDYYEPGVHEQHFVYHIH